jgi:hypothetical protein
LGVVGPGTAQIFSNKTGVDLQFRRLVAGAGINLSQNSTDIQISNSTLGTVTSVGLTGSSSISITGASPITSSGTFALDLTNTGVAAGTYSYPTMQIDAKGRILAISNNIVSGGTVTSVTLNPLSNKISISGSPITTSGTINLDVNENNLNIANMTCTLSYTRGGTGLTTTTLGSLLVQTATGYNSLPIGTQDQVLTVDSGNIIWSTISAMTDPTTTAGDLIYRNTSNAIDRLPVGSNNQVLTVVSGTLQWANSPSGFADPMTTSGDIIIRNNSNITSRLPVGTNNQILTVIGGNVVWSNPAFTNPLTTAGDLMYQNSSATRLPIGTNGQVLTVDAGLPKWMNNASGFSDPMTNAGDIIIRNGSNTTTRLPIGTTNQVLSVGVSGVPEWATTTAAQTTYTFKVNFDGSGNIDITTPFSDVPVGWSISRDNTNQFTVTHNLGNGATPKTALIGYALHTTYGFIQKIVTGNPPTQYSCTFSPTNKTFTVYSASLSNAQVSINSYILYKITF